MYILSIDSATKTLGMVLFEKETFDIKDFWLVNLHPQSSKQTNNQILARLKYVLGAVRARYCISLVIHEYQMPQNNKSNLISSAIQYEFAPVDEHYSIIGFSSLINEEDVSSVDKIIYPEIIEIKPSCKNTIALRPNLAYGEFISRFSSHTANKKHVCENFTYYLHNQNVDKVLKEQLLKLKFKELNHLADAFAQAYFYIHD